MSQKRDAIEGGRILVNGKGVDTAYALKENDCIEHHARRRESPVIHAPVQVVYEDECFLVVDKPSSLPVSTHYMNGKVHPCGNYRHNTLVMKLQRLHGYSDLKSTL